MKIFNNICVLLIAVAIGLSSVSCLQSDRDNPTDPVNVPPPPPPPGTANAAYDYFVNAALGDDANAGTLHYEPKKSIGSAVTAASAGDKIAVAEGTYSETLTLAGVEIYGGFPDDLDWSDESRDGGGNVTVIQDTSTSGGGPGEPISAILVTGSASDETVIDGFTINAGSSDNTCGIDIDTDTVAGYTLKIMNNVIHGGGSDNVSKAYGIFARNITWDGSTYTITIMNNAITGGDINVGDDRTNGICNISDELDDDTDSVTFKIFNNTIDAAGNTIIATGTAYSYGMLMQRCTSLVYNNTISAGENTGQGGNLIGTGIFHGEFAHISICNNLIFADDGPGNKYGVMEYDSSYPPDAVDSNNIFNCNILYLFNTGTTYELTKVTDNDIGGNFITESDSQELTDPLGTGNFKESITFTDDEWRYESPTKITTGGIDGSSSGADWGFDTDKDGNPRTGNGTKGWSMGAYEHD